MPKLHAQFSHGGQRQGAGRKPRYLERMERKSIRLPSPWIKRLTADFGSLQAALETLIKEYLYKHSQNP